MGNMPLLIGASVFAAIVMSLLITKFLDDLFKRYAEHKEKIENEERYDLWVNGEYMLSHRKVDCKKEYEALEYKHSKRMEFDKEKKNCWVTLD